METIINVLTDKNGNSVGLTTIDPEGRMYTHSEVTDQIIGVHFDGSKPILSGYRTAAIPIFDVDNNCVRRHGYALLKRQGDRYIVVNTVGYIKNVSAFDIIRLIGRGVMSNCYNDENGAVHLLEGDLPIENLPMDTVLQLLWKDSGAAGCQGLNDKFVGVTMTGRIGIVKIPVDRYESMNEVACYRLGKLFGVDVAEAAVVSFNELRCVMSYFMYDPQNECITSLFKAVGCSDLSRFVTKFNMTWLRESFGEPAVQKFYQMLAFDTITRQTDRDYSNIAFYNGNLYSLFDNGRSLFYDMRTVSINPEDMSKASILNMHGFDMDFLKNDLGCDKCRALLRDVTKEEIYESISGLYGMDRSRKLAEYMYRVYCNLTGRIYNA